MFIYIKAAMTLLKVVIPGLLLLIAAVALGFWEGIPVVQDLLNGLNSGGALDFLTNL